MSELVLLANEQNIDADTIQFLADGSVRTDDISYTTTTPETVEY